MRFIANINTANTGRQIRATLIGVLVLVGIGSTHAQTIVTAALTADSTHTVIGDHLHVLLTVRHPKNTKVVLPVPKDMVGTMDLDSLSKIDTIEEATTEVFKQTYTLVAFDSGSFQAGPVQVYIQKLTGFDSVLSNAVMINVSTVHADTSKVFKDIKPQLLVPYNWNEFIPYYIGFAALILLIVAGILLYRYLKNRKPVETPKRSIQEPPHIWARAELKKIEDEKLWQKGEVKLYYSRLTDVLRLYLEFRFSWQALESTTAEIEKDISRYNMKEKAKASLLEILRTADLVKFAKQQPMPDINIRAMEIAYKFIEFTEPKEEETKKEQQ